MGSNSIITTWFTILLHIIVTNLFSPSFSQPVNYYTSSTHISSKSLDDYLYNCSLRSIHEWPYTGVLYNVSVPANLSGMELSILRLRSSTLWIRGANFSSFSIPTGILTVPFVKRVSIMYENFGNLSSHYHVLPGYNLLSPVVGLAMYDASELSMEATPKTLNITKPNEPIQVKLSHVLEDGNAQDVKCARFDPENGTVELSNVVNSNSCLSQMLGHFALVMPSPESPTPAPAPAPAFAPTSTTLPPSEGKKDRNKVALWKWWLIGFGVGLSGLIVAILCCIVCTRVVSSRKIMRLERGSETSEALGTTWIGDSKMPSANMIRTQADIFETDH